MTDYRHYHHIVISFGDGLRTLWSLLLKVSVCFCVRTVAAAQIFPPRESGRLAILHFGPRMADLGLHGGGAESRATPATGADDDDGCVCDDIRSEAV